MLALCLMLVVTHYANMLAYVIYRLVPRDLAQNMKSYSYVLQDDNIKSLPITKAHLQKTTKRC